MRPWGSQWGGGKRGSNGLLGSKCPLEGEAYGKLGKMCQLRSKLKE